jgi:hypothetical protein
LGLHHLQLRRGSGDWPTFIRKIPALLSLRSVALRNLSSEQIWNTNLNERRKYFDTWEENGFFERAVEDYILRGGMFHILNKELFDLQLAKEISSSLICPAE